MKKSSAKTARKHKHLLLDQEKIEKAQTILGARTETETIERALELVIEEDEKNRRAWVVTERLLKNGVQVKDVFGRYKKSNLKTSRTLRDWDI